MNTDVDIVIAGGGISGLAAAIAAARMGVSVALVEKHDVLGGMGTAGLVNNFCPAHLDGSRLIIGGILAEIRRLLAQRRAIYLSPGNAYTFETYNPRVFCEIGEGLCREAGVQVLLRHKIVSATFAAADRISLHFDEGSALVGRVVVDATGDAVLAPLAKVPFQMGAPGCLMPLTFCYKIGPINLTALRAAWPWALRDDALTGEPVLCFSGACDLVAQARERGELTIPVKGVAAVLNIPGEPDYAAVNFGRVFVNDPTDPDQIRAAEELGRKQIAEGERFLRAYFSGFENVHVVEVARQIGVRESRRIEGLYTLTEEDVLGLRQFDDAIAQCCYAIDVHDPNSSGTRLVELPRGSHYDIPWRCMIPRSGPANILFAGRCISATQAAMSSFRVEPSVMATGEAAGVTAAYAVQDRCAVREVSPQKVRQRLLATGGILS